MRPEHAMENPIIVGHMVHLHPSAEEFRHCPRCGAGLEQRQLKAGEPARLVCTACDSVLYLDPKLAACTICTVDGGIVLLKRAIDPAYGKWVFPGGFVDRGETVSEAAVRETREEAQLDVRLTGILDVYSFPGQEVVVVVYAAETIGGRLAAGDESLEAKAFLPEQLPWDQLAFDSTHAALRDYVRRFFPRVRIPRG
jgi:ADP-ribose pyrophosphatase YjhB (NUDIX family)